MNKKILGFILLISLVVLVLPIMTLAAPTAKEMADGVASMMQGIGAAIVVIGWVVAGILYLLAAGKPEKMETAKKAVIAAVIGTVLIIIAGFGYSAIQSFLSPITSGGGAPASGGAPAAGAPANPQPPGLDYNPYE